MKSPTDITEKVKQLKFEYLKAFYRQKLAREPQNCVYNREIVIRDDKTVVTRVCTYFSDEATYQICDTSECSRKCNAFVERYNKQQLREFMERDIEESPEKYPEVMALAWVLDKVELPVGNLSIIDKLKWKVFEWAFLFSELCRRVF